MEYLDLYDENAKKTGKVIVRGTPIRQGEYSMSVHLYIYNQNGDFLLQKRSKYKKLSNHNRFLSITDIACFFLSG